MRTPVSTCCRFHKLRNSKPAPQSNTSDSATSPITIARRKPACPPEDPRDA